jgi:hypothetical protein
VVSAAAEVKCAHNVGQGRAGRGCEQLAVVVDACTELVYMSAKGALYSPVLLANVRLELTQPQMLRHSISCRLHRSVLTLRTLCRPTRRCQVTDSPLLARTRGTGKALQLCAACQAAPRATSLQTVKPCIPLQPPRNSWAALC